MRALTWGCFSSFWMSMSGSATLRGSRVPTQVLASKGVKTIWLRGDTIWNGTDSQWTTGSQSLRGETIISIDTGTYGR